jgi:2-keto-4-pentenoate hydratase/2-oxohepta-3-ene-1,7-dioic acid hydratase in catechol pathway
LDSQVKGLKPLSRPKNAVKLCTFLRPGERLGSERLGMVEDDRVVEIAGRDSMRTFLASGRGAETLRKGEPRRSTGVKLLSPVPRPGKIVAAIVNTQAMLGGNDVKLDRPRMDMKAPSAVIGPGATILAPRAGFRPEVELAAVVGRRISHASPNQAGKAIFGYTILNDVTAPGDSREDAYEAYRRDTKTGAITKRLVRGPLFRSKNHDTFCPIGPWIVSSDELVDVSELRMTTRFNGKIVQDGSTAEYLFQPEEIASYVSGFLTLEPGDVVSCGSIGWTGLRSVSDPAEFILDSGNGTLELTIEGIGSLLNPVKLAKRGQA